MSKLIDLTGRIYGRWHVLHRIGNGLPVRWVCRCSCGTERTVISASLLRGRSNSCGCLNVEAIISRSTKHGAAAANSHSGAYESWRHMRARCLNPDHKDFAYYGGRGVKVCERWSEFANFLSDMGERERRLTLERIDVNGDYEPGNCCWATRAQQTANRRPFTQRYTRGEDVRTSKLTEADVVKIRSESGTASQAKIAARYGVGQTLISMIVRRKIWAHVA